jgi:hypothetical protein
VNGDDIVNERLRLRILKKHLGDFDAFARTIVDYVQPHSGTLSDGS